MSDNYLMVHYGELGTKGENKKAFINQLYRNLTHRLKGFSSLSFQKTRDRIYVRLNDEIPGDVIPVIQEVSGIQKISLVEKAGKSIEEIKEKALSLIKNEEGKTFKAEIHRADKTFPLSSYDAACSIGDYILDHTDKVVDVHTPDIVVSVDIREEGSFIYAHSYPGAGGYPLGMNGKALMLLSGGIDSPVASYLLLRRGVRIECIHFAAPPYTSDAVLDKLKDIIARLGDFQADIKLHVVPFTKLQEAIYQHVEEPYCITIMRRMMVRIAEKVAKNCNCLAIATGESIGQVASQTLVSMRTINDVTNFPIIRPCATLDKIDIIAISKKIGTYETSIRPYEDCCTIFAPKKPKTKPKISECEYFESSFDWKPLLEESIEQINDVVFHNGVEISSIKEEGEKQ